MFRRWAEQAIERIVVAVDPPATSNAQSDGCGIVVAGRAGEGRRRAARSDAEAGGAAGVGQAGGGGVSRETRRTASSPRRTRAARWCGPSSRRWTPNVPVRMVHATRGKWVRAEPVAALYARGW